MSQYGVSAFAKGMAITRKLRLVLVHLMTSESLFKCRTLHPMLSHRIEGGLSVYYAIETVTATLDGQSGTFILCHEGVMDSQQQKLDIQILPGSGTDDLRGIKGSLKIIQNEEGHAYELTYQR